MRPCDFSGALLALALAAPALAAPLTPTEAWREQVAAIRMLAENDALRAYQQAQQLERDLGAHPSVTEQVMVLNLLARSGIDLAMTTRAAGHIARALALAPTGPDRAAEADANIIASINAVNLGDVPDMKATIGRALALAGQVAPREQPELRTEAMLRAAMLYRRLGQLDDSVAMAMSTMEVARRSGSHMAMAYAYQGLGVSFDQSGRPQEALENFRKMREEARAVPSRLLEGYAMVSLSYVIGTLGDERAGERMLREAVTLFRASGARFGVAHASFGLATNLASQKRYADALAMFDKVIAIYADNPNQIGLWWSLYERSDVALSAGQAARAKADARRAYALAGTLGLPQYQADSARRIAHAAAAGADFATAYRDATEAEALNTKVTRDKNAQRMLDLAERYHTESKQHEIDELTRRNAQQGLELRQRQLEYRWLWTVVIGGTVVFAATAFLLLRLRRSHATIAALNAGLERRVLARTAELRRQKRYLRTLIDTLPSWIWLKDVNSHYLAVNQAVADVYGLRATEMVGRADQELVPAELAAAFRREDLEVMNSRVSKTVEQLQHLHGVPVWVETFKAPVIDEDGTLLGTVGFARDVGERKAAEASREAALLEAQRLARLRSDFLAQMSHELRTPLNAILGYAQVLRKDATLNERQRNGLSVILHSGEHLLALINDVLDMTKIEAGKLVLTASRFALVRCIDEVGDMMRVRAHQQGLDFVCVHGPDLPALVQADERRLRQVLLNLLSNAFKFTRHGEVRLEVRRAADGKLRFEVADSGAGIDSADLDQIFQPFEQVGAPRERQGGTGLGLAIARQFVRLMGGELQVESELGVGSRFWFELALPQAQDAPEATPEARPEAPVTGYEGPRKTILVVDDVAANRALLRDMLEVLGFVLAEADGGEAALRAAAAAPPALVLMDAVMPEMDGIEALRRLRALPGLAGLPAIAVSASTAPAEREHFLAAGMNAFLSKPLDYDALLEQIGALLQLAWVRGPAAAPAPSARSWSTPPRHLLLELLELAQMGNMQAILAWAEAARTHCDAHFIDEVKSRARHYQSKQILALVRASLAGASDD